MDMLRVQNLHKTYLLGRVPVPVLRGVDLAVRPGEFVAVLGASGSGKSTLLHLLGGLDRPDRKPPGGPTTLRFEDGSLLGMSSAALDRYRNVTVGFVFQFYHLLPELNVLENVMLPAMVLAGAAGALSNGNGRRQHAQTLISQVGLSHRIGHHPAELSGGERQRVAIARALMNRPRLLLADEPTGNLDRATGGMVLDALLAIRREQGQTLVVVTHDEHTAGRADRVVRLIDGRIEG
jgi:lipoprotein-releasing system ATP-binding protein